jgi:hypothetical protein
MNSPNINEKINKCYGEYNPEKEMHEWKNISLSLTTKPNPLLFSEQSYPCKELDETVVFNQKAFKMCDNALLQLFFSDSNVSYIKARVKEEVKKLRNQDINTNIDNNALENLMQSTLTMCYQGKFPQIIPGSELCNMKNILATLNGSVITQYVQQSVSSIDMYKYYINDITTLPMPLDRPTFTKIQGSNVTSQQVGLESVTGFNREIRNWNNRFSYFD